MKFSIAMTCYNCAPYISTAMVSVMRQSYKDWELIFVDDRSTDLSFWIADKARRSFPNLDIKVYKRKLNGGYGPCLMDAIEYSSGEIIVIVDADDSIVPNALERMAVMWKQHPDAAIIYSSSWWCDKDLHPYKTGPSGPIPEGSSLLECLTDGPKTGRISHLKTFRKDLYDKLPYIEIINLRKRVDKTLMIQLEELGSVIYFAEPLYYYRDHPLNLTNQYFKWDMESREYVDQQWKEIKERAFERRRGVKT